MTKKQQPSAAQAATAAATAPAEQQGNLPAGPTSTDATASAAPANAAGAENTASAVTEQISEAPGADAALTAVESAASNTGQEAHLNQEAPEGSSGLELAAGAPAAPADGGGHSVDDPVDDDLGDGEVEGLWIRAVPEQGLRRCGMRFTREGSGVALSALTSEQVEALYSDPNLHVEHGFFSGLVG